MILRSLLLGHEGSVVWASLDPDGTGYGGTTAHIRTALNPWLVPAPVLAKAIDAVATSHSAAAVWAVAHGPIVPCLPTLEAATKRRLHLSVHDDPAWTAAFRGRRELALVPWLHRQFGRALTSATSVDVIGGGMRSAVARRAGRDSVIVHRVLEDSIRPNETPRDPAVLTIGLLGNVYAVSQLKALTGMLDRASDMLGIPTRLVVIGGMSERATRGVHGIQVEVEFLGHMAEADGLRMLRSAFALYVGYPFGLREREFRRTSFPAKLATYLQAARPLLVHAPYDSSLSPLFGLQPFAIPWVDQDLRHGARVLSAAWSQTSLSGSQHDAAEAVRKRYFGADNRDRLFGQLNALVAAPQTAERTTAAGAREPAAGVIYGVKA